MNKKIAGILILLLTTAIIYLVNSNSLGVPPLGKQLSPTHGFWKNAKSVSPTNTTVKTPNGNVEVIYDELAVPHLFAPNERALYYAQGYIQATDRLFQMDFQTRVAGGTLSEAVGEVGVGTDRFFRRLGLKHIAKQTSETLKEDSTSQIIAQSYADGVNAYINSLKPSEYPLEFKLQNYAPEPWSVEKSILLLKFMAYMLAGSDADVPNTNTANLIGLDNFHLLFPDYPKDLSPIIPKEKIYDFEPVANESQIPAVNELISSYVPNLPNPIPYRKGIGSNNWAVGKDKTSDGSTIVCNDPHLGLSFPSIWYQMQLHTPEQNVYGVTIPGSPGIIIGFNEDIAWGVTNSGRDIKNWYTVQYENDKQESYLLDSAYLPIEKRVEVIYVNGGKTVIDTVRETKIGPIVYDQNFGRLEDQKGLAMHWVALQPSNEMKTFYLLNKAKNHDDYLAALNHFETPGQNFVFGDNKGNVAIKNQGKFQVLHKDEGRFIQPLEKVNLSNLEQYIPQEQNPHILNPTRGFVSSANQQPTDSTYPYYYTGSFEHYRNRRINQVLDSLDDVTIDDVMWLQNDNYNLMAAEILPFLLNNFDDNSLDEKSNAILDTLKNWNYFNEYNLSAPTYFQKWWTTIKGDIFDEFTDTTKQWVIPNDYQTYQFMKNNGDHYLIDNQTTTAEETVKSIIADGFSEMTEFYKDKTNTTWQYANASSIMHLMKIDAFSRYNIEIGGSENAVNAVNQNWGPSWRMIVKLNEDGVKAYGVYPGGQSGNPSSKHYNDLVEHWRTGQYFELQFYKNLEEATSQNK